MSRFTEDDLKRMGLTENPDGSYSKIKQITYSKSGKAEITKEKDPPIKNNFRSITITLFGEPMPKQSVRATRSGHFFQPKKMIDRVKDYEKQIKAQLPDGWVPFSEEVHVTKLHFIFAPLKGFSKVKGKMDAIRDGKRFYKTTKPDLMDNLKKLPFDAMSGLVYKDDGLVCTETDVAKYYGIGGCIIIELTGK